MWIVLSDSSREAVDIINSKQTLDRDIFRVNSKNTMNMDGILANACLCRGLPLFSPSEGSVEKKKEGKKKKKKKVSSEFASAAHEE